MKKVFSDISQIAHLWANKLQDEARNSGNFYFDGKTIYSYGRHFPIAKHVEFNGKKAVLFTQRTYSNTTSGHVSVVRNSVNHIDKIYCYSPDSSHEQNFNYWITCLEAILANLKTARKPEKYLSQVDYYKTIVDKYVTFFNVETPSNLAFLLSVTSNDSFSEYNAKKAEFAHINEEKRIKALKEKHKKELKEFREGKRPKMYTHDGFDYLTIVDENFVTSQGVKIPLEIGLKFYSWIKSVVAKGGCDNCDKEIIRYQVRSVSAKQIVVGCHTITIKEIERAYSSAQLATI